MRVLISSDFYPPFIGGGHAWAHLLARGLRRRGHEVAVLTEWHGGMDRVEVDEDWTVYRIRQLRTLPTSRITDREQRHSPPFSDPISARDAAAAIDAFRPDVCISYGWITLSALGALKRRRIPVLLSAHDYGYFCPTRTLLNQGEPCSGPAPLKCLSCAGDFYGPTTGTGAVLGLLAARPRLANGVAGLHTVSSFVDEVTWGNLFGPKGPLHHVRRFIIPPFIEEPPPITPLNSPTSRSSCSPARCGRSRESTCSWPPIASCASLGPRW
jgi:glycosyltransferase involved in cell wall biosynthesis